MEWVNDVVAWLGAHWEAAVPILISVIAATFTGFTMRYARSQRDSAKTQANAAEAQVEQMRRQNELLEKQLDQTSETVRAVPYVPPWSLKWHKGDTYELVNGGNERVHNVVIDFLQHEMFDKEEWDYIDPRSSKTFKYASTYDSPHRDVKVMWSRDPEGEEQHSWEGLIPPKGGR